MAAVAAVAPLPQGLLLRMPRCQVGVGAAVAGAWLRLMSRQLPWPLVVVPTSRAGVGAAVGGAWPHQLHLCLPLLLQPWRHLGGAAQVVAPAWQDQVHLHLSLLGLRQPLEGAAQVVDPAWQVQMHLHPLPLKLQRPLEEAAQVVGPALPYWRHPHPHPPPLLQSPQLPQTPAEVAPAVAPAARHLVSQRVPLLQSWQVLLLQRCQAAVARAAAPSWRNPPNLLLLRPAAVGPAVDPWACLQPLQLREGAEGKAARAVPRQARWLPPARALKQYSTARPLGQHLFAHMQHALPAAPQLLPPP